MPRFAPWLVILAACSGSSSPQCRVGADCASGACRADGTCAPADGGGTGGGTASGGGSAGGGTGGGASGGGTGGGATGGGTGGGATGGGGGGSVTCQPNHDGTITRAEVPVAAGLRANYLVATNATFNSAGTSDGGTTAWDFTVPLTGDATVLVETRALTGQWFENDFAGASYTAPLPGSSTLLAVFETTADALLLRGVVSKTSGTFSTRLTYTPPAKVLAFPITGTSTWTTTSTVSGTYNGVITAYSETYDAAADKAGQVITPFASFPAQRVKVVQSRTGIVFTRQYLFVTECFGTVATLVSQTYESQAEFTSAAEVRRLTP